MPPCALSGVEGRAAPMLHWRLLSMGLWRSWERASMAWKRSRVRISPGPPTLNRDIPRRRCRRGYRKPLIAQLIHIEFHRFANVAVNFSARGPYAHATRQVGDIG